MLTCSICHYEPVVPGFDVGEKCLQIGLDFSSPDVDAYPHWPVVEESEWFARKGRPVVTVAYL